MRPIPMSKATGEWWTNFWETLAIAFSVGGISVAIWQFYDKPAQLAVPLLLAGIACWLLMLVATADGIVHVLDELYFIAKRLEGSE